VWGIRNEAEGLVFDKLGTSWFWAFDAYLQK
jgi:hypothetical protein